ncbi:helix-turn-helix transcriptional regulator [Paraburkholderia sp. EG287A]|uniref:helix-turn-helix transcriptional regulator n=1 Tax=Paraburkholderia sp. EG287A TaxID=3237012 RepID=UPI0034D20275
MIESTDDALLSVDEVAALLTVSKSTVSRLIARGKFIAAYRIAGVQRWRKSAVIAWLETTQEHTK